MTHHFDMDIELSVSFYGTVRNISRNVLMLLVATRQASWAVTRASDIQGGDFHIRAHQPECRSELKIESLGQICF